MPMTLTLTEGALPAGTEKQAIARLTDAFLARHGLTGNRVMTPNVTATLHVLPRETTFSGGEPVAAAWVEWKTPSFAFASEEVRAGFFEDATAIIHELSGGKLPREHIYINVVHAVDGGWSLNGEARSNSQLGEAITAG